MLTESAGSCGALPFIDLQRSRTGDISNHGTRSQRVRTREGDGIERRQAKDQETKRPRAEHFLDYAHRVKALQQIKADLTMYCKGGQRLVAAALCAVMVWSLFATPAAAMSAALHFGTPTKLSRMSFDVTAYPASFFEASCISRQQSENETLANFMASHHPHQSVAALECALVNDEQKTIRLRGGDRRSKPAWKMA